MRKKQFRIMNNDLNTDKTFGLRENDVCYIERVGVYCIIFDNLGKTALIRTSNGYYLLGGGLEKNETHIDCILRECVEEAGQLVRVNDFLCKTEKFHWSDFQNCYMHETSYFYRADTIEILAAPIEKDHELVWLPINEASKQLLLDHQRWAMEKACQ